MHEEHNGHEACTKDQEEFEGGLAHLAAGLVFIGLFIVVVLICVFQSLRIDRLEDDKARLNSELSIAKEAYRLSQKKAR